MHISLKDKVAVITGAASGIGLATAQQFLESEITGLIAVDLQEDCPAELQAFGEGSNLRLVYVQGDVALQATAQRFTEAAMQQYGRIDILINNAGVSVVKPIDQHTEEEWDRVMNTNVKAVYQSARTVVPVMKKQGSGLILNTGSISGEAGIAGQGAYGPSKGAIHQMSRQMAIEYASDGIRVNTVALGTVDTPIVHDSARQSSDPAGFVDQLRQQHPLGRIASAQEVAKFFTFLVSDCATFFTGATLMLDGGFTAR